MAIHPTDNPETRRHEISLMCDDVEDTVASLTAKGATFESPITHQGWGLTATLQVPGAGNMLVYEPRHPVAYEG